MRKLFAIVATATLGLGIASNAGAVGLSFSVVSGNPAAMTPGDTVVISLNYTVDIPGITSAVTFVQIVGTGTEVIRAQTTNAGGGHGILTNFDLESAVNVKVGATCANSGGGNIRTCDGPPNGSGAGGFGGLSLTAFNQGTYSVGTLTIEATAPGAATLQTFIVLGGGEWQQFGNDLVVQPAAIPLVLNVVPEPTTAALIGLGLAGLVAVGRRNRA